jgi:hypothetical protein
VFGTILKKKEKTTEWFNDYLTDLTKAIKMTGK